MTRVVRYSLTLAVPDDVSMDGVGDAIFEALETVDMPEGVRLRHLLNEGFV